VRICARMTNVASTKRSGYCVQVVGSTWTIRRIDTGAAVQLGATVNQTVAAGARLAITVIGSTIKAWYSPTPTGAWTLLITSTDSTYATAGYLAIESRASHVDDFGGGGR
jgi:hypothetical protein